MIAFDDNLTPRQAFLLDQAAAGLATEIEAHLESLAGYDAYLDSYFAEHPGLVDQAIDQILSAA